MTVTTAIVTVSSSSALNLGQMITRVYTFLRDSDQAWVTKEDVRTWLNDALLDLNARLRLNLASTTGTVGSDGTIQLPADLVEPVSLSIADKIPKQVPNEVFLSWKLPGSVPGHVIFRVVGNTIETYPTTSTASMSFKLEYVKRPSLMLVDADLPTGITRELQLRMIHYAVAQAKVKDGNQSEASYFMTLYLSGLPDAPRELYRDHFVGQGLALTPIEAPYA